MIKALIFIDRQDRKRSVDLLEVVYRLYDYRQTEIHAVLIGKETEEANGFFNVIHQFRVQEVDRLYDVRWVAACIKELQEKEQFSCILIPATAEGRMLAPTLAMKLKTGLVADVTEVRNEDGVIQMVRPAFGGKIMASIVSQDLELVMMSVRLGIFQYQGAPDKRTRQITHCPDDGEELKIQLLESDNSRVSADIRDARVLVSGGGGVQENFTSLLQLAKSLNGMVSVSRRLVDQGIAPRSMQVGQSGKIVSPSLYIALGIYGSLQHIEGLHHVEHIISVNKNRNAPICSLSEIVVEGDAVEFVEKLSIKIKQNQTEEK